MLRRCDGTRTAEEAVPDAAGREALELLIDAGLVLLVAHPHTCGRGYRSYLLPAARISELLATTELHVLGDGVIARELLDVLARYGARRVRWICSGVAGAGDHNSCARYAARLASTRGELTLSLHDVGDSDIAPERHRDQNKPLTLFAFEGYDSSTAEVAMRYGRRLGDSPYLYSVLVGSELLIGVALDRTAVCLECTLLRLPGVVAGYEAHCQHPDDLRRSAHGIAHINALLMTMYASRYCSRSPGMMYFRRALGVVESDPGSMGFPRPLLPHPRCRRCNPPQVFATREQLARHVREETAAKAPAQVMSGPRGQGPAFESAGDIAALAQPKRRGDAGTFARAGTSRGLVRRIKSLIGGPGAPIASIAAIRRGYWMYTLDVEGRARGAGAGSDAKARWQQTALDALADYAARQWAPHGEVGKRRTAMVRARSIVDGSLTTITARELCRRLESPLACAVAAGTSADDAIEAATRRLVQQNVCRQWLAGTRRGRLCQPTRVSEPELVAIDDTCVVVGIARSDGDELIVAGSGEQLQSAIDNAKRELDVLALAHDEGIDLSRYDGSRGERSVDRGRPRFSPLQDGAAAARMLDVSDLIAIDLTTPDLFDYCEVEVWAVSKTSA
ncbi:MAG: hypothetical protein KC503_25170 [Myxococcales bacterium]|nr:hypothetical protein [Myxococcales bacterium]